MENEIVSELAQKYGTELYRFCMHLCPNKDEADELYQNTFLKLILSQKDVSSLQNIRSFLFSAACFIHKSDRRKAARRHKIAPIYSSDEANTVSCNTDLQNDTIEKIRKQTLLRLINELDEKYRVPIILFYGMDMQIFQIAQILKCSPNTVKSRLFRAKDKLKQEMEALGFES